MTSDPPAPDASLSFATGVAVPGDVLQAAVEPECVLLDLRTQAYYGLDAVGTRMWTLLTTLPTIEAAYQALLEEYDVEPDRLRADLGDFVRRMVAQGLLQLGEA